MRIYTKDELNTAIRGHLQTLGMNPEITILESSSDEDGTIRYRFSDPVASMSAGRVSPTVYEGQINPKLADMILTSRVNDKTLPSDKNHYSTQLVEDFLRRASKLGVDIKKKDILYNLDPNYLRILLEIAEELLGQKVGKLRRNYERLSKCKLLGEPPFSLGYAEFVVNRRGWITDLSVHPYTFFSHQRISSNFSGDDARIVKELTGVVPSISSNHLRKIETMRNREKDQEESIKRFVLDMVRDSGIVNDEEMIQTILSANSYSDILAIMKSYQANPNASIVVDLDRTGKIKSSRIVL